ncbi:Serine/threonine-protein kinase AFC2 [Durusdinium trenchii]|uniref:Serine/threonine-protein kinase AFC2 n=3 Tax=Durusdinium trenchii TaxID=1381693 RepID=A0ABP0NIK5_9DINO
MAEGPELAEPERVVHKGRRHKRRRHRSRGNEGSCGSRSHGSAPGSRHRRGASSRRRRRSRNRPRSQDLERSPRSAPRHEHREPRAERHRDGGPPHIEVEIGAALGEEGRYIVEEVFGDGASGRVLGCREEPSGKLVAVKVSRPARRQRRHAETEVATLQKLQRHNRELAEKHVVRLLDTFEHDQDFYCIVMEPLAMSLRGLLQEGDGGMFLADLRSSAHQLTNCFAFFQSMGLAHGDLKCTNVMLRRGDYELRPHPRLSDPDAMAARPMPWPFEVVVIDFGLANIIEPETSPEAFLFTREEAGPKSTRRGGARHIRAPEVILGLDWGCTADMWSLGCLLSTLYTGDRLFPVHEEMEHLAAIEHVTGSSIPKHMAKGVAERIVEKGVSFDDTGRLLWPETSDEQQARHVEEMATVREFVLDRHHDFLSFLEGLLSIDPASRLTADRAIHHPFLRKECLTEVDSDE